MATPCEADFSNEIAGDVERYFQLTNLNSRDRVALFASHMTWRSLDLATGQVLYERFFFGPQNVLAAIYYDLYDKDSMMDRVTELFKCA